MNYSFSAIQIAVVSTQQADKIWKKGVRVGNIGGIHKMGGVRNPLATTSKIKWKPTYVNWVTFHMNTLYFCRRFLKKTSQPTSSGQLTSIYTAPHTLLLLNFTSENHFYRWWRREKWFTGDKFCIEKEYIRMNLKN